MVLDIALILIAVWMLLGTPAAVHVGAAISGYAVGYGVSKYRGRPFSYWDENRIAVQDVCAIFSGLCVYGAIDFIGLRLAHLVLR